MADIDAKITERRRARRTRLKLRGRFLLSDGGEHPCETIDVSVTGLAISGYIVANLGERVIAYIDELGRLEGVVTRRGGDWFAIDAKISPSRIDRYAEKLAALSGDANLTAAPAQEPKSRPAEVRTEFGQSFSVRLSEETRLGARVLADFQLLPGTRLTLEHRSAFVVRDTTDGFLIDFE